MTSLEEGAEMVEFWYNVRTHQVEEDAQSDWTQLIGPYATREEAEKALEKVKERNRAWDPSDADGDGWSEKD